jgi:hypothetical protein
MKIEAAAKDIVAAGDNHRFCAAFALLNLIEREMYCANDGDIDRIAARRSLERQRSDSVRHRKRQGIHFYPPPHGRLAQIMPPANRHRKEIAAPLHVAP